MTMRMPFIHLIADYGASDPAFSEVVHRLTATAPEIRVQTTAVQPLSTVATGFWIAQLGLHNPPFDDLLIYSNTAPRSSHGSEGPDDIGGQLCYLELDNGVPVVAVDVGYNLSFVRDRIRTVHEIETPQDGSQFRSRDHFPTRMIEIVNGNFSALGADRSIEDIPPPPASTVCHVDGYGNIKTSIRASTFDPESECVAVEIDGETRTVVVSDAVDAIEEGELAMLPGSAGGEDPYIELFLRGGSAAAEFEQPQPGDELTLGW